MRTSDHPPDPVSELPQQADQAPFPAVAQRPGPSGAEPSVRGAAPRDLWVNAFVLGLAAVLWCGWAQSNPPAGWTPVLLVGGAAGLVLAVVSGTIVVRHRNASSRMGASSARRTYNITVGIEAVACLAGALVLSRSGRVPYIAPWILLVVGVHFLPLAKLMRITPLAVTGVLVSVVAVLAFVLGTAGVLDPTFLAGGAGGALLILGGLWSAQQGRRCVATAGWHPRVLTGRVQP